MKSLILTIHLIIATSVIVLILMQAKGVGLGRAWGGGGEFYKSRRGVEKVVFQLTIILASLFLVTSILNLIVS